MKCIYTVNTCTHYKNVNFHFSLMIFFFSRLLTYFATLFNCCFLLSRVFKCPSNLSLSQSYFKKMFVYTLDVMILCVVYEGGANPSSTSATLSESTGLRLPVPSVDVH